MTLGLRVPGGWGAWLSIEDVRNGRRGQLVTRAPARSGPPAARGDHRLGRRHDRPHHRDRDRLAGRRRHRPGQLPDGDAGLGRPRPTPAATRSARSTPWSAASAPRPSSSGSWPSQLVRLDGGAVLPDGLLARMFAASSYDDGDARPDPRGRARPGCAPGCCPTPGANGYPRGAVPRAVRRGRDLGRGRHAQAGAADLPARRSSCSGWTRRSACSSTTSRQNIAGRRGGRAGRRAPPRRGADHGPGTELLGISG